MTRDGRGKIRGKVFELALAATVCSAVIWAAARYGPRGGPAPQNPQEPRQGFQAPPPATGREEASRAAAGVEDSVTPLDGAARRGHSDVAAREFADRLESRYRGRGYARRERNPSSALTESSGRDGRAGKFYWRVALPNAELIIARGSDADPNSEDMLERSEVFLTTVAPAEGGGTEWSTYRYHFAQEVADALDSGADFPGADPPLVPRAPGTRRLLSLPQTDTGGFLAVYTSGRPAPELAEWYVGEMSKNWSYDHLATSQARQVAEGTFCFTRPGRFCLLWLMPEAGGQTTLVVSLRYGRG